MHAIRKGRGRPLVLVHGLGSDSGSWRPVWDLLSAEREVIAVDLPGHGYTPPLEVNTIATFTDALVAFLAESGLIGADLVGSSVGARLVLELARRGHGGAVVALDPGGFWENAGARYIGWTLGASVRAVGALDRFLPTLTANPVTRSALLVQLSARPWRLSQEFALAELRKFAGTAVFAEVLHDLVHGPRQGGMPAGTAPNRMMIAWGRRDRVTPPRRQAERARSAFPDADFHLFRNSGHFPLWDMPVATAELILSATGR